MPPTITQAFPPMPLAEIVALVDNFSKMSIAEKKVAIECAVAVHPTNNMQWGSGSTYRRCRPLLPDEIPENVDGLIWRTDVPARLGRANPVGFQVIYLADRPETSLRECRVADSRVVITDFVIREACSIRVAPIGEMLQIQRTGRGYLSGDLSDTVSGMLNACDRNDVRSLLITDAFLHHCFVGQDDHEISSHVASAIFRKNPAINAIAYPSTQQLGAINFAVRVEGFWEAWGISGVTYGHARHLALGFYEIDGQLGVDGIHHDGTLDWVDLDRPDRRLVHAPPFARLPGE
ncbi:RES domain-containing protein [Rhizobium sp. BK060]|uniref:RES domain-containing protein n=1 Tax=Rhizobium sp. BK060 TaxID=2587096 RepID=UPI00161EB23C|nr:RES domain-containing protein [Rhizobium sp. BK060]MBB3394217.1 hypothetical protein [Rhizobium sp. BK060]